MTCVSCYSNKLIIDVFRMSRRQRTTERINVDSSVIEEARKVICRSALLRKAKGLKFYVAIHTKEYSKKNILKRRMINLYIKRARLLNQKSQQLHPKTINYVCPGCSEVYRERSNYWRLGRMYFMQKLVARKMHSIRRLLLLLSFKCAICEWCALLTYVRKLAHLAAHSCPHMLCKSAH